MDRVDLIADPRGAALASAIFGAIAILIGISVTVILRRLAAPAGEPSYIGTTPRARRVVGAIVALAGVGIVWVWLWSGFYSATVTGDTVDLLYLLPPRIEILPAATIARVTWITKPKGQRALQITMSDGAMYTSASGSLPVDRQDAIRSAIEAAAARSVGK